jgi:hypothetical protein
VPCSSIVIRQTNIDRAQVLLLGAGPNEGQEWQKNALHADSVGFFFFYAVDAQAHGSASKHQAPMQIVAKRKRSKKRNYRKPISNARFQMVGKLGGKSKKYDSTSMRTKPP